MSVLNIKPRFETEDISAKKFIRVIANHDGKKLNYTKQDDNCGYMVYFPQGHSIHVRSKAELRRLGFDCQADLVDMENGDVVPTQVNTGLKEYVSRKTKPSRASSAVETLDDLQS